MIRIDLAGPADRDDILDLLDGSDSTPRSVATWDGNPLHAVIAREDDRLIGVLPLEDRTLITSPDDRLRVLWVTGAHVEPEYRSQGIGGRMDAFAEKRFCDSFDAICVFREDETSRAYNWYRQRGFHPLARIPAYLKTLDTDGADGGLREGGLVLLQTVEEARSAGAMLADCFRRRTAGLGGFRARAPEFWANLFTGHYYRDLYRYFIAAVPDAIGGFDAYALLGETDMRDGINRYDLLEFVAAPGASSHSLMHKIARLPGQSAIRELRIQFTGDDPCIPWFESEGYVYRDRSTNILGKLLAPGPVLERRLESSDLRWEWRTPGFGLLAGGTGSQLASLASTDAALTQFCFHRLGPAGGDPKIAPEDQDALQMLATAAPPAHWRYFQADYA